MDELQFFIYVILIGVLLSVVLQYSINRRGMLHSVKMGKILEQSRNVGISIQNMQNQLAHINGDISRLSADASNLKERLDILTARVDSIQGRLDSSTTLINE